MSELISNPIASAMVIGVLAALLAVAIVLLAYQHNASQRSSRELQQLARLLEQALDENAVIPTESLDLGDEISSLTMPINKLLEARAAESYDRQQLLTELARGLNHNMNNLLFGILGAAQLIRRRSTDDDIRKWAETIGSDGRKLTELIHELTEAVTGQTDQSPETVDLNAVVENLVMEQLPGWQDEFAGSNLPFEFHSFIARQLPSIRANRSGLRKLLLVLLSNAKDALVSGGNIWLTTAESSPGEISLTVRDDGVGMDAETRRRVFDPFFTTKKGIGSGLGLSTVLTTVKRWDGTVAVVSEPGGGTTFTVTFPAREPTEVPAVGIQSVPERARVFVVDDQPVVGEVIRSALQERYEVSVCQDAESALRTFKSGRWDIAMIDLGLPGLSGEQLARRLKESDENLVRILMTGWVLDNNDPRREHFEFHLQKPVADISLLNQVIEKALAMRERSLLNRSG